MVKNNVETKEPSFDQLLEQLREVVAQLESGNLSLGESLETFERGVSLARKGHDILDSAEKRVEVLMKPPGDGTDEVTEPLEGAADDE